MSNSNYQPTNPIWRHGFNTALNINTQFKEMSQGGGSGGNTTDIGGELIRIMPITYPDLPMQEHHILYNKVKNNSVNSTSYLNVLTQACSLAGVTIVNTFLDKSVTGIDNGRKVEQGTRYTGVELLFHGVTVWLFAINSSTEFNDDSDSIHAIKATQILVLLLKGSVYKNHMMSNMILETKDVGSTSVKDYAYFFQNYIPGSEMLFFRKSEGVIAQLHQVSDDVFTVRSYYTTFYYYRYTDLSVVSGFSSGASTGASSTTSSHFSYLYNCVVPNFYLQNKFSLPKYKIDTTFYQMNGVYTTINNLTRRVSVVFIIQLDVPQIAYYCFKFADNCFSILGQAEYKPLLQTQEIQMLTLEAYNSQDTLSQEQNEIINNEMEVYKDDSEV